MLTLFRNENAVLFGFWFGLVERFSLYKIWSWDILLVIDWLPLIVSKYDCIWFSFCMYDWKVYDTCQYGQSNLLHILISLWVTINWLNARSVLKKKKLNARSRCWKVYWYALCFDPIIKSILKKVLLHFDFDFTLIYNKNLQQPNYLEKSARPVHTLYTYAKTYINSLFF